MDKNVYLYHFLFKVIILLGGILSIYLGYELFCQGLFNPAGDIDAAWGERNIKIKQAAPGTFFALFGSAIICLMAYKGFGIVNVRETEREEVSEKPLDIADRVTEPEREKEKGHSRFSERISTILQSSESKQTISNQNDSSPA